MGAEDKSEPSPGAGYFEGWDIGGGWDLFGSGKSGDEAEKKDDAPSRPAPAKPKGAGAKGKAKGKGKGPATAGGKGPAPTAPAVGKSSTLSPPGMAPMAAGRPKAKPQLRSPATTPERGTMGALLNDESDDDDDGRHYFGADDASDAGDVGMRPTAYNPGAAYGAR